MSPPLRRTLSRGNVMSNRSKYLMIASALILLGAFLFPIWNINLEAPQYPEGIGLRIWVNQVTGEKEFDLKNINGLNHYIGMKPIVPDAIPELKYMPYILIFLSLTGILIAFLKKRKMLLVWIVFVLVVMSIGLYDFYMWGYDYGHNLDSTAPIKVPGMSYQPPVIGTKKLLNITATSLPGLGSILIFISVGLATTSYFIDKKGKEK